MDKEARRKHLTGIAVSLPTFNDDEYNLQLDRSKAHINWLIDQGIGEGNAIVFIAGGLGEGYFLDDHEWEAMANTLVEAADGRAPTGIGVFELSARRAARKAKYAADLGMDYIQCAPPRYLQPTENEIFGSLRLHRRAGGHRHHGIQHALGYAERVQLLADAYRTPRGDRELCGYKVVVP